MERNAFEKIISIFFVIGWYLTVIMMTRMAVEGRLFHFKPCYATSALAFTVIGTGLLSAIHLISNSPKRSEGNWLRLRLLLPPLYSTSPLAWYSFNCGNNNLMQGIEPTVSVHPPLGLLLQPASPHKPLPPSYWTVTNEAILLQPKSKIQQPAAPPKLFHPQMTK